MPGRDPDPEPEQQHAVLLVAGRHGAQQVTAAGHCRVSLQCCRAEVEALLQEADTDGDGRLSLAEFVHQWHTSEAMDE